MSNEELVQRFHDSKLPGDLSKLTEQFITAAAALRPHYPPELLYQINFGERCLLRELVAPDDHESHWWETGLYIIQQGIAQHPGLKNEFSAALDELKGQLTVHLGPYNEVTLREINSDTVTGICLLSELVTYPQNTFVAPNSYSLAQALFHNKAWYRAVYAGKAPIGFIMLEDNAEESEYYLWRFMIAPPFQRRGLGAQAVARLIDYVKTRPDARELMLSYIDHKEGPAEFYRGLGFVETGEIDDGEVIMKLDLAN